MGIGERLMVELLRNKRPGYEKDFIVGAKRELCGKAVSKGWV